MSLPCDPSSLQQRGGEIHVDGPVKSRTKGGIDTWMATILYCSSLPVASLHTNTEKKKKKWKELTTTPLTQCRAAASFACSRQRRRRASSSFSLTLLLVAPSVCEECCLAVFATNGERRPEVTACSVKRALLIFSLCGVGFDAVEIGRRRYRCCYRRRRLSTV